MKKNLPSNKGFSLVELLVVITIIAILSVTAYVALGGQVAKARDSKRIENVAALSKALEIYYAENAVYPDNIDPATITRKMLSSYPYDPLDGATPDQQYYYAVSADKQEYLLAATLEKDGNETQQVHVVTNSDTPTFALAGAGSKFWDSTLPTPALAPCVAGPTNVIAEGQVGTADDGSAGSCIPYDPID